MAEAWVTNRFHPYADRVRRARITLGLALVAVGVVLLGYVGWELVGTTVVSHRHRDTVLGELRRTWEHSGQAEVRTGFGTAQAIVRIPRFGASYAVPLLEGTAADQLSAGFGHVRGSAAAGGVGNFAISAHRITHGQPLRKMPELRAGDLVVVQTRATTYTYRLLTGGDDLTVDKSGTWVLGPVPRNPRAGGVEPPQRSGQRLLTLTTCAELFHTDDRLVAFGALVGAVPSDVGSAQSSDE